MAYSIQSLMISEDFRTSETYTQYKQRIEEIESTALNKMKIEYNNQRNNIKKIIISLLECNNKHNEIMELVQILKKLDINYKTFENKLIITSTNLNIASDSEDNIIRLDETPKRIIHRGNDSRGRRRRRSADSDSNDDREEPHRKKLRMNHSSLATDNKTKMCDHESNSTEHVRPHTQSKSSQSSKEEAYISSVAQKELIGNKIQRSRNNKSKAKSSSNLKRSSRSRYKTKLLRNGDRQVKGTNEKFTRLCKKEGKLYYACPICKKTVNGQNMSYHFERCKNERKYKCSDCLGALADGKNVSFLYEFNTKKDLVQHIQAKHRDPIFCEECGASFSRKSSRNRHIKTFHPDAILHKT